MTRKVSFDVVAEVQVKVRVKIPMTFVAEEGISFEKAIRLALKSKRHSSADLQDGLRVEEILAVDDQDQADDYTDQGDWLVAAVEEKLNQGKAKFIDADVVDSR